MGRFCCVVGCSSRSERDKSIRFFNVPLEITHQGVQTRELSKKTLGIMASEHQPRRCFKWHHQDASSLLTSLSSRYFAVLIFSLKLYLM